MSTAPPGTVTSNPTEAQADDHRLVDKIVIYGHSNLMYWWPVWAVSFLLAALTYFDGYQMAVIPPNTEAVRGANVMGYAEPRDVLVAPAEETFNLAPVETKDAVGNPVDHGTKGRAAPASMTVSRSNTLGVVFAFTLFLVALVSTVTFRGLVSMIVIILMITAVVTLALLDLWDNVFAFLGGLDIRMNAAGYLFVGIPVFLAWVFVVFVYDRQRYMVFDENQIRYVLDVGDSAMVVPADGAVVEKKRDDVFRHWLFGFGTGDFVIRTGGPSGPAIEMENVTNVNRKLRIINDKLRHKPITMEQLNGG